MGYRVDSTTATLVLYGMDGAEVTVLIGVPLSALREWDAADGPEEEWACFLQRAKPTWNLEDAHGAIPVDETSIDRIPFTVARSIMSEWRVAAVKPPAPLPRPSSDGDTE